MPEDPVGRQALVDELRRTERALREVPNPTAAVAELSRGQERLQSLAGPGAANRRDAAAAAGSALSMAPSSAAAGAALSELADPAAEALRDLANALENEQPAEVARELAEAADVTTDPALAAALRQASAELAAGQADTARQSLASAAEPNGGAAGRFRGEQAVASGRRPVSTFGT